MQSIFPKWRRWAAELRHKTYALYLAYKDPRVPKHAKIIVALVVAYALSPIDLIPDFIPIIGYLDDLILIPLGIALAVRMVPHQVMRECLEKAQSELPGNRRRNWVAGAAVIFVWALVLVVIIKTMARKVSE